MLRPAWVLLLVFLAAPVRAQDGAVLYAERCGMCHDGGVVRAPARRALSELTPERIVAAISADGVMRMQGAELSADQRGAIAVFLTGKALGTMTAPVTVPKCSRPAPAFSKASPGEWNGRGATPANSRFQRQPGEKLAASDVPKLKLKWAFGFAGDTSAAIQPTVVEGRVFLGSASGRVYALSLAEGCAYWTFDADSQVRTAMTVSDDRGTTSPSVFFADVAANVYSVDAYTGQLRWKKKVDDHPVARVTGTPRFHDNRLYVPVSSLEELAGADPKYPCCTFRGSVVALDAAPAARFGRRTRFAKRLKPPGRTSWARSCLDHRGVPSGHRRRSTSRGARSISAPATVTRIRRHRPLTRSLRSISTRVRSNG